MIFISFQFEAIELRAMRLSASLGVGSIKDKTLAPALVGFVREGLRFAFSTELEGTAGTVLPGDRLRFLLPLSK
jgi:cohesin complex subunit SA-1/2